MLDKRYKYSLRLTSPFYLFRKNRRSDIFYVRFKNGKTVSTRETTIEKAYEFALHYKAENPEKTSGNGGTLAEILDGYFVKGSKWLSYDTAHGSRLSEKDIKNARFCCGKIAALLPDIKDPKALTKQRLHRLQEALLSDGLSGKTVNNYMSIFHKVYKQLVDLEIVENDPFSGLRNCWHEKQRRTCFPVESFRGYFRGVSEMDSYDLAAYCAVMTGARRAELLSIRLSDIGEKNGITTLRIRGTKSEYSDRTVPISKKTAKAIERLVNGKEATGRTINACVSVMCKRIGYDENKAKAEGIVFHSFRKMYKTILTAADISTSAVETLMGHTTNNQSSNNVERIYFVAEKADLSAIYRKALDALSFLESAE